MTDRMDWESRREDWTKRRDDYRTHYEVDLGRIMHSASFRRLGSITQIISNDTSLVRTRLSHTLEVEQIAGGIVQRFRGIEDLPDVLRTHLEDPALTRSISLVHDLGHPPFGHAGEEALNCSMRGNNGGFEGNGQTLRILSRLENFSESCGSNLTRRALLGGALKYPVSYSAALKREVKPPLIGETGIVMVTEELHAPPKCYMDTEASVVSWMLQPLGDEARMVVQRRAKSVDASLMDASDDIAYAFADLDDAITLRMIEREDFMEDVPASLWDDYIEYRAQHDAADLYDRRSGYEGIVDSLFSRGGRALQRETGRLMGYGMANVAIRARPEFRDPLYAHELQFTPSANKLVNAIKRTIFERVILDARVQHGRLFDQSMMLRLFDAARNDPRHLLPSKQHRKYEQCDRDDRVICDWLAGSSERFVAKLYARMFTAGGASVTDRI